MRLLKRNSDDELSLHIFDDQQLPAYAILSHTWIRDEEITYDDFTIGAYPKKAGWAKIQFCAARASQDGLQYFWVDTCCIDKRNNTELTAAINSMYSWYQRAAKCYVYLSDVQAPDKAADGKHSQRTWEAAFRKSRWFTRGWTLQELLAPTDVEFFSKEGNRLGSKESLVQLIHDITDIPIAALREPTPHRFGVDERMSWITKRNTTVQEDKAYCLLGIFGVFLPLIYGEGEAHAFKRLKELVEAQARQPQDTDGGAIWRTGNDHTACLQSLGFSTLDARQKDIAFAHPDTCDWLFDTAEFREWRDQKDLHNHNGVLWLKGKPGAGKSTLMKHTLHYCEQSFNDHLIIAHFFNTRGERLEQTALGMMRSVVYQLVKNDSAIRDRFVLCFREKQMTQGSRTVAWRSADLSDFIVSEIKHWQPRPILLMVDALDECNETDVREVVKLFETLSNVAVRLKTRLRICLSSRHYPTINMKRKLEIVVERNKEHHQDIIRYVTDELEVDDDEIKQAIQNKSDGVFLWAVLVVAMLNEDYHAGRIEEMQRRLYDLPGNLEDVFEMILAKGNTHPAETVLMLQWVLFSPRPLKPEELFFAVMTKAAPELLGPWDRSKVTDFTIRQRITNASRGLIEVRSGGKPSVQFIHRSVNDFLLRNQRLQKLDPTLGPQPAHTSYKILWSCCKKYMQLADTSQACEQYVRRMGLQYPFMQYAMRFALHFANKILTNSERCQKCCNNASLHFESEDLDQPLTHECCEISRWIFDYNNSWCNFWRPFLFNCGNIEEVRIDIMEMDVNAGLLYTLSNNGYERLVRIILSWTITEVNAQGGVFGNALQAASIRGWQEVVQQLLAAGADVNAQGGEYGNALQAASFRGWQEVVQQLLAAGADVNAQGGAYGNALQAASFRGWQEVVQQLLAAGADVNAQGGEFGNALQAASFRGSQEVVRQLLAAGADVNAQGGEFGNALQAASYRRSQEVVQQLLATGADVNAQGGKLGNALQAASSGGSQEVVQQLLAAGADVNAQGGEYGNALQAASYRRSQEVVQQLLAAGADVNAQGGKLGNALQAASYRGSPGVVRQLLAVGPDVNAQGGEFGNALQAASYRGWQEVVQQLLAAGADVNAQGGKFGNALQAASSQGWQEVVQQLLAAGADVNAQGGKFGNALQAASSQGWQEVVQQLLAAGADVNMQGGEYGNALQAASYRGWQKVKKLLVDAGARHAQPGNKRAASSNTETMRKRRALSRSGGTVSASQPPTGK